ncbi:MAG TPA: carboxynorspermidine decarboxylase [Candidatus Moranbacteria bacterium]|nr:carboxynorspermidine decarboxylase [Candidatus Moranbacteria bacterium]
MDIFWAKPEDWKKTDTNKITTPCYLVSEKIIERNLQILDLVQKQTGAKIILALKGFSMFSVFPLIRRYLHGTTASSLFEAKLGKEEFGKEVHIFSPAYKKEEFWEIMKISDHIVFNSFSQWKLYKNKIASSEKKIGCSIRVNPEHSEVKTALYDPCDKNSRLGVKFKDFEKQNLSGITGLHFHTLCESGADSFARTLDVFEKKFGKYLDNMKFVNFGGGHHITRSDYNIKLLCKTINAFKKRHPHLEIYLEPGEAVALNTGILVASVLDIIENKTKIAILDTSFATHMPDTLEMPYRPEIIGGNVPGKYPNNYKLGGISCLAGDMIGNYSFKKPLQIGDKLIFLDMAHYTMVKNNTFNGINLPSILIQKKNGKIIVQKKFEYLDFKNRLS